jgi:DNA replication protein DnaC
MLSESRRPVLLTIGVSPFGVSQRGLDKGQLSDLDSGRFIRDGLNILILGPTGVGKTFLASAIGNTA